MPSVRLYALILPPCISTNALQRFSPIPVPSMWRSAAVVSLVETFEESVGLLFLQSDACIFYLDDGILFVLTYDKGNVAAIKGILHGVGEQVGNNLVEVDAVYPNLQLAFVAR